MLAHGNINICDAYWYRKLSPELVFVPIRDSYGTTQLIYKNGTNDSSVSLKKTIDTLSNESVVCVEGMVVARSDDMVDKVNSIK